MFYIAHYEKDKFLIGSSFGLSVFNTKTNSINYLEITKGKAAFYIVRSKKNIYWTATISGIYRLEIQNGKVVESAQYHEGSTPSLSHNNCRVLLYDDNADKLYIGTEGGGLNVMQLNSHHKPESIAVYRNNNKNNSIINNYIRSLYKTSDNTVWVGTYEGLNKFTTDKKTGKVIFKAYTHKNGLPNNMIQFITDDAPGNLWIGTNNGLVKFNPEKENAFLFTQEDGLQSNEFSEHTVYKSPKGEIIIGGIKGINTFYPEKIKFSKFTPKVLITNFYLFSERISANQKVGKNIPLKRSISLTDSIFLLPDQNNISFDFSALLFSNPGKVKYMYKLEGFDKKWNTSDATMRNAKYTNLPYGKYIFKVKASNEDGLWSDKTTEIHIRIKTPFALTWYAFILYAVLLILVFLYFSYFSIIKQTTKNKLILEHEHNQKIQELNQMRTRFFINVSHDLRTPLTLISGQVNDLLQKSKLSEEIKEKLQIIKRNVKRLNYLVEQVLDVRKAESGTLKPKLKHHDIVAFTKSELLYFNYAVAKKGLELQFTSETEKIDAYFDQTMLSKVFFNLISNAIKFTTEGGIYIHVQKVEKTIGKQANKQNFVEIEVKDTGKGMSDETRTNIFERFYQDADSNDKGYGIGLSHCNDLIKAHSGFIEVESIKSEGTVFRVYIPEFNENLKTPEQKTEITTSTEDLFVETETVKKISNTPKVNEDAKTILIVEDNLDMRNYIKNNLTGEFNVTEAEDGTEGLKKAKAHTPDLIISDVMMPNMDGIEFCKQIKTNINTSHIPVILLTAKVDIKTKYEGIETGADDYIPKPFEMEYLIIRIRNLMDNREKMRKKFQKSTSFEPKSVTVTSIDEEFLTNLLAKLEKAIPDFDFSVNTIEEELAMSHSTFYRKVKSLTGKSAKEILQDMRMKRAYQILSDTKGIRINELAFIVGFSNPKYFSKCFKERYGIMPSEIKK